MAVDLSRYYEWKKKNRDEGRAEGLAEGLARGRLVGAIEGRLRRTLADDELARFERRITRDGHDAVQQRAHDLDDHALARWVAGRRVRAS